MALIFTDFPTGSGFQPCALLEICESKCLPQDTSRVNCGTTLAGSDLTGYNSPRFSHKQECIPVGCVLSTAVAMFISACTGHCVSQHVLGRWVFSQGVSSQVDDCLEVSSQGGICPRGSLRGGFCQGRGCIPACTEADIPPAVDRMTDRCKNIIFAYYVCGW